MNPAAEASTAAAPAKAEDLWLGRRAPRYTSYPPAPFFHAGFGAEDVRAMLAATGEDEKISLYIHVPFCERLCLYCGCHMTVTHRAERVERYIKALAAEAALVERAAGKRLKIACLHFGGGTPNIMEPRQIDTLFEALRRHFDFSQNPVLAVEIDPRVLNAEKAAAWARGGMTRASLGIQDFNPKVQALVHREEPFEVVERACALLRKEGVTALNLDLMYGLPLQTPDAITQTAEACMKLHPTRLALFSYAHVPRLKPHQKALEDAGIPGKHELLDMDRAARAVFAAHGFVALGMDHFARPGDALFLAAASGRMRRNFQGYTEDAAETLVGLGASSISKYRDGYAQNEKDIARYEAAIGLGELATARGLHMSDDDRLRATIIERLMCDLSADIAALVDSFDVPLSSFAVEFEELKRLETYGIVALEGGCVRLTAPHRMAIRVVAARFDTYSREGANLYSRVA